MKYNKINGTINGTVRQSKSHIYKVLVHTNKKIESRGNNHESKTFMGNI